MTLIVSAHIDLDNSKVVHGQIDVFNYFNDRYTMRAASTVMIQEPR